MRKTVKTKDLEVGMYVVLPLSWMKHSFLKSQFIIGSRSDIQRIAEHGIREVTVDTAKGMSFPNVETISHAADESGRADVRPPVIWEPDKIIPDELKQAVRDRGMPPRKRAKIVYRSSVHMMERLLDDPKAENIKAVKRGIADIVDLIVSSDSMSQNLLNIAAHDFYTYTHSVNVGVLGVVLTKSMFDGSDGHDMHELGAGFFLHDIGKVRVDAQIINKPGRLTEDEMRKMRIHPYQGCRILSEAGLLSEECRIAIMQHHEREDGKGYPRRMCGDDIHVYGRIGCIADVYDALTADRSYKPKLDAFSALQVMKTEMINHFRRDVFEKFVLLFS
jgi:HD-GYP domain-containing protein (c-di-GMP phosphodiesterase class II)